MQLELFDHVQVAMQLDVIYRVQRESARGWTTVEERSMRSPPMAQTLQVRAKGCVCHTPALGGRISRRLRTTPPLCTCKALRQGPQHGGG